MKRAISWPYRCKPCRTRLDLPETDRQIYWWATPDGVPGIVIRGPAGHTKLFKDD